MTLYYITKGLSGEGFTMSANGINEVRKKMIDWGAKKNVIFHVQKGNRYIGAFLNTGKDTPMLPKYYWNNGDGKVYSVNPKTGKATEHKPKLRRR